MQRRFGTPELPRTAFCPNCHVKITPGTQICSNCNSRICTHCYQIIPSMTATVCPKCGKRDFLKKPLKDIRLESTARKQASESFTTETEYICPICHEKMVLLAGGTLKCQSRSCGYLVALKEFLDRQGKDKTAPASNNPIVEDKKIASKKAESIDLLHHTTSIETKSDDQYFWKRDKRNNKSLGIHKNNLNIKYISFIIILALIITITTVTLLIFLK